MAGKYPGVTEANGNCFIRWQENGTRVPGKALDIPYTPTGIKAAYKIRQNIIKAYLRGDAMEEDSGPVPTFEAAAKSMLASSATERSSSRRVTLIHLNNYWMPLYQDTPIDKIRLKDIKRDFAKTIKCKSPKYVKNILSTGSRVFEDAIEDSEGRWIDTNPVTLVTKKIKVTKKVIDPFTFDERDMILDLLNDPHQLLFYTIRFYMGLRPGEAIALRWSDWRAGDLHVTKTRDRAVENPPKNNIERTVPIHPKVLPLLEQANKVRQINTDYIILTKDLEPYNSAGKLSGAFSRLTYNLGLRWRSPYNARHTCASMMLTAGMKPAKCAEYLGHTTEMFFRKYAKLIDDIQGDDEQIALWANAK